MRDECSVSCFGVHLVRVIISVLCVSIQVVVEYKYTNIFDISQILTRFNIHPPSGQAALPPEGRGVGGRGQGVPGRRLGGSTVPPCAE